MDSAKAKGYIKDYYIKLLTDFKLSDAIFKYFKLGEDGSKTKKVLLMDDIKNYKSKLH